MKSLMITSLLCLGVLATSTTALAGGHAQVKLHQGVIKIHGTNHADVVEVVLDNSTPTRGGGSLIAVYVNQQLKGSFPSFDPARGAVKKIVFHGKNGDDFFYNGTDVPCYASGGHGNDVLVGGYGNDVLKGDEGHDQLFGSYGHDKLYGGDGNGRTKEWNDNDYLYGGNGQDHLKGGYGQDVENQEGPNEPAFPS